LTLDPLKVSGFPGATSSIDEKVEWFARLDRARYDEGENDYFKSMKIADSEDIANAILYHACPDEIGVVFKMKREHIEAMDIPSFSAKHAKKNGLLFNALRGFTKTYKSCKVESDESKQINWANYKKWLLETQKTEFIIIGTFEHFKGVPTVQVLNEFIREMGLDVILDMCSVEDADKVNEALRDIPLYTRWEMQHYLGEHFYSKTLDELKDEIKANVCMEVLLKVGEPKDLLDWELELTKAMVKSRETKIAQKSSILWKSLIQMRIHLLQHQRIIMYFGYHLTMMIMIRRVLGPANTLEGLESPSRLEIGSRKEILILVISRFQSLKRKLNAY